MLGAGFTALLAGVLGDGTAAVDGPVARAAVRAREPWLTDVLAAVTWLGSAWVLAPLVAVVAAVLAVRQRRADAGLLVVAALGASALESLVKVLVARPRPALGEVLATVSSYAFPSGHSTQAAATWGALALLVTAARAARVAAWTAAVVVVLLVGASRVYLGVHWPTDVLGGFLLGAWWLALVAWCASAARGRRTRTGPRVAPPGGAAATAP